MSDGFSDKLRSLHAAIVNEVSRSLMTAAELVVVEAQISITTGAVSGKEHEVSAPGDAPNNDSSVLANNIEAVQKGKLRAEISSNAPYSTALEFGTSKMAARPFMGPARDKMRPQVEKIIRTAAQRAIRKHFRN